MFGVDIGADDDAVANLLSAGDFDGSGDFGGVGDEPETGGVDIGAELLNIGDDDGGFGYSIGSEELLEIGAASPAALKAVQNSKLGRMIASVSAKAAKNVQKRRLSQAIAVRNNRVMTVQKQRVTTRGMSPFGFRQTILAGASTVVQMTPPVPFLPLRLLISSNIAGGFSIYDIKIGQVSYLVGGQPVPAMVFEEKSENQGWGIPTVQVGQQILMTVQNDSGADAIFQGAWLGKWFG